MRPNQTELPERDMGLPYHTQESQSNRERRENAENNTLNPTTSTPDLGAHSYRQFLRQAILETAPQRGLTSGAPAYSTAVNGASATNGTHANGTEHDDLAQRTLSNGTTRDGGTTHGTTTDSTLTNGTLTNGTLTNGTLTNGTLTNGTLTNGTLTNGTLTNGTTSNGTHPNTSPPPFPFPSNSPPSTPTLLPTQSPHLPDPIPSFLSYSTLLGRTILSRRYSAFVDPQPSSTSLVIYDRLAPGRYYQNSPFRIDVPEERVPASALVVLIEAVLRLEPELSMPQMRRLFEGIGGVGEGREVDGVRGDVGWLSGGAVNGERPLINGDATYINGLRPLTNGTTTYINGTRPQTNGDTTPIHDSQPLTNGTTPLTNRTSHHSSESSTPPPSPPLTNGITHLTNGHSPPNGLAVSNTSSSSSSLSGLTLISSQNSSESLQPFLPRAQFPLRSDEVTAQDNDDRAPTARLAALAAELRAMDISSARRMGGGGVDGDEDDVGREGDP